MGPQCVGRMAERATQLSTAVAEATDPMAVSRQDLAMRRADLLAQLVDAAVDVGPLLGATRWQRQLDAMCEAALLAFGAAAVSVARAHDDHLRYVAASGAGAESIVGTELGLADGLAGFVAASGQAMVIDQPANDPRFARDVAERTGYVPDSMLLVPVDDVDRLGRRGAHGARPDRLVGRRPRPSALRSPPSPPSPCSPRPTPIRRRGP